MRSSLIVLVLALSATAAQAQPLPSANMLIGGSDPAPSAPVVPPVAAPTQAPASIPSSAMAPVTPAVSEDNWGAIPALPLQIYAVGDVRFINGGIGDEELEQLKSTSSNYSLHLQIIGTGGEYVSDLAVRIVDAKGAQLLALNDAGPYLYVTLKPGQYTLEYSYLGSNERTTVTVPATGSVKKTIQLPS